MSQPLRHATAVVSFRGQQNLAIGLVNLSSWMVRKEKPKTSRRIKMTQQKTFITWSKHHPMNFIRLSANLGAMKGRNLGWEQKIFLDLQYAWKWSKARLSLSWRESLSAWPKKLIRRRQFLSSCCNSAGLPFVNPSCKIKQMVKTNNGLKAKYQPRPIEIEHQTKIKNVHAADLQKLRVKTMQEDQRTSKQQAGF